MKSREKLLKQYPEFKKLRALKNPKKIQDFLNALPINWGKDWNTCRSVLSTLRAGKAHCIEGAFVAAAALYFNGQKPLVMDLKTTQDDYDHVVTLFKVNGCWGALSKTSHAVLRYREPIYKTLRELALSYFHEYFLDNGKKTLRSFSDPFDLRQYGDDWLVADYDLWQIPEELDDSPHKKILTPKMIVFLRKADKIEIKAGKLKEG
ncbi:MAG: hypothetical protein A2117_02730 [Candidatus Wildermuthbacteria bacterium GWA2_46_15]|uniref:Transglutaminase-like domain-containing protein n=1 Tax=Candidatus Wildermuthbacteria bacterium GWA2_46_15 TaxID=1802443 RepID=A0A1G2QNJ1_9BACT|nr:MAG: hypothetical protein A2117_02730 [Candidatus Wildermuthbacteria bacterium GWA2_46_15]